MAFRELCAALDRRPVELLALIEHHRPSTQGGRFPVAQEDASSMEDWLFEVDRVADFLQAQGGIVPDVS